MKPDMWTVSGTAAVVTHLFDYGYTRFEMGYASAIAVILFVAMILCKKAITGLLGRVGT